MPSKLLKKRDLWFCLGGLCLAYFLNFSERFLVPQLYSHAPAVMRISGNQWHFDLNSLPSGMFYLSAGRPTGPCSISFDGKVAATTKSIEGSILESVTLASSFEKSLSGPSTADIACEHQRGFDSGLTDPPAILSYIEGRNLQFYREFISIWLAPMAAVFLLFSMITLSPPTTANQVDNLIGWIRSPIKARVRNPFIVFGLAATLYGCSLSYIGWMFLPDYVATFSHIVLRFGLSLSFLTLGARISGRSRPYLALYLSLLAVLTVIFLSTGNDSVLVVTWYKRIHVIFGLTTLVLWLDIQKSDMPSRQTALFGSLALLWTVAQWSDTVSFFLGSPVYNSPVMLAIVTWVVGAVKRAEVGLTYQVGRVSAKIVDLSALSRLPIEVMVKEVSMAIASETHFERLSVYIDAYCLGRTTRPHRILMRVFEHGYKKETDRDFEITLEDGRGRIMTEAMRTGTAVFRQGSDQAWFCVVSSGSLVCINLSDSTYTDTQTANDSFAVVQRLRPTLKLLEDKLLAANLQRNVFLQRVKAIKGFGTWPMTFGVIRLDIEDSSRTTTKFQIMNNGRDIFGEFAHGKYIPALLKSLSGFAELEEQIGDELYLIVVPELSGDEIATDECTAKALRRLFDFILNEGAKLCVESGFEPLSWTGGATFGQGTLICDEFKVRTSGTPSNLVKRLQDSAKRGTFLIDEQLVLLFPPDAWSVGELRDYLVKKDRISARTLYYSTSARKAS